MADPYRLKNADVYSNILFVKNEHSELAHLARRCAQIDKYRPQTCCVLGNFYGLRSQHDKAVLYFQRALRLQPRYALVWTLIGACLHLLLFLLDKFVIISRPPPRSRIRRVAALETSNICVQPGYYSQPARPSCLVRPWTTLRVHQAGGSRAVLLQVRSFFY